MARDYRGLLDFKRVERIGSGGLGVLGCAYGGVYIAAIVWSSRREQERAAATAAGNKFGDSDREPVVAEVIT